MLVHKSSNMGLTIYVIYQKAKYQREQKKKFMCTHFYWIQSKVSNTRIISPQKKLVKERGKVKCLWVSPHTYFLMSTVSVFILAVGFWSLILEHVSTAEKTWSSLVGRSVQGAKAHPLPTCEIMSALSKHYALEFLKYIYLFQVLHPVKFFSNYTDSTVWFSVLPELFMIF